MCGGKAEEKNLKSEDSSLNSSLTTSGEYEGRDYFYHESRDDKDPKTVIIRMEIKDIYVRHFCTKN